MSNITEDYVNGKITTEEYIKRTETMSPKDIVKASSRYVASHTKKKFSNSEMVLSSIIVPTALSASEFYVWGGGIAVNYYVLTLMLHLPFKVAVFLAVGVWALAVIADAKIGKHLKGRN